MHIVCSAALNIDLRFLTGSGAATLAHSLDRLFVDLILAPIRTPVPGNIPKKNNFFGGFVELKSYPREFAQLLVIIQEAALFLGNGRILVPEVTTVLLNILTNL